MHFLIQHLLVIGLCLLSGGEIAQENSKKLSEQLTQLAALNRHVVSICFVVQENDNPKLVLKVLWDMLFSEDSHLRNWSDGVLINIVRGEISLNESLGISQSVWDRVIDLFLIRKYEEKSNPEFKRISSIYLLQRKTPMARKFVINNAMPSLSKLLEDIPVVDPRTRKTQRNYDTK